MSEAQEHKQVSGKGSILNSLTPAQLFIGGIVEGVLVLCTIGFFILLAYTMGGSRGTSVASADDSGPKKFSQCVASEKYASVIQEDQNLGASLGVQGTPATFINGYLVSGALPYSAVKQVIDTLLEGKEPDFDFLKDEQTGQLVKVTMPELPNVAWRGNPNAGVSLVEFSDFECPYCARFEPTIEQVLANYGDKVRFTYRHFPLSFHTQAERAALSYECAREQGKGWEMHDKLFEYSNNGALTPANMNKAATEIGLK